MTYLTAVWVVFWLRPFRPAGLYLVGAGYQGNLAIPHNTHGVNAMESVGSLGRPRGRRDGFATTVGLGQVRRANYLDLDAFRGGGLKDHPASTVLIYLTAQGGAERDKGAFVFQGSPWSLRVEAPEVKRLYVKDIIEQLAKLSSKRFCLILDVTLAPANVQAGMLHNDFIRKLRELEPKIAEARNLVVLAAADSGQRTWAADSWRETVFGHFVEEGLRRKHGESSRIDSRGLFDYVERKVKVWSWVRRGEVQAPILLPDIAPNFDLARASEVDAQSAGKTPPTAAKKEVSIDADTPIPGPWEAHWRACWKDYHRLKESGPEAYAPAQWRDYRDWLLRYESLARSLRPPPAKAGKSTTDFLAEVEKHLRSLAAEIEASRRIKLGGSLDNSLAMEAIRGRPPDSSKVEFDRLWDPKEADKLEITERNRPAYYEALIRRLQPASVPEDFTRAREVLVKLDAGDRLRPIEAHFLAILIRDMPKSAPGSAAYRELIEAALKVRRLAERSAVGLGPDDSPTEERPAYAEQVAPWIEDRVAGADKLRRKAEDLLFADDPARWEEARAGLGNAVKIYEDAQSRASRWRDALVVRNRAFSDLPYYGTWSTRRASSEALPAGALDDLLLGAWAKAHALDLRSPSGPDRASLPDLGAIEERFRAECVRWEREVALKPGDYNSMAALLDTPFLDDGARRKAILDKLKAEEARSEDAGPSAPSREEGMDAALQRSTSAAHREGRLARAALRDDNRGAAKIPGSPDGLNDAREVVPAGHEALVRALDGLLDQGVEIGQDFRQEFEKIATFLKERRPSLLKWPVTLEEADRLERLSVRGRPALAEAPALAYRDRLLRRLLLRLARRSLEDHWYSEDDDPEAPEEDTSRPYFKAAARAYLDDIASLSGDPDLARLEEDLGRATRLDLKSPPSPLVVTDEPALVLNYRIEAPVGAPGMDGRPVVRLDVVRNTKVRHVSPSGEGWRVVAIEAPTGAPDDPRPRRLGPAAARFDWRLDFSATAKAEVGPVATPSTFEEGDLQLEGRYRGQVLRGLTKFQVYPVPEIVVTRPPRRPSGDVIVRADPGVLAKYGSNQGGSLVIVLDCSGSMGPPRDRPPDPAARFKYREATEAIGTILRRVTRGTRVSLWAFGQAVGPAKQADQDRTIAQILEPTPWDPRDEERVTALMRRIEYPALEPYNRSPIVRTMLRAAEDFRGVAGFKTMLVLTDGLDTSFEGEGGPTNRPNPQVEDVLRRAFAVSDVEINVVGYKLARDEEAVRRQFRVIEEFRRPGTFYPVGQAGALADALASGLRPSLRYSAQSVGNVPVTGEITLGDAASLQGFKELPPGGYKLVVESGGRSERGMIINRDDHLMIELVDRRGRIGLERVAWTKTLDAPARSQGDWRFAALKSQMKGGQLSFRACLEKLPLPGETALEVIRPREVWMEVKAGDLTGASFQQRWSRFDGYPAASWELTVPTWPDARPKLSAWWDPDREAEPLATLRRAEFPSIEEARDRVVPVEGNVVVIESVELERLAPPGEPGKAMRLVVRASCPPGRRFWVRLRGFETEWAEHRFYTRAGKYTGLYWPVTEDQVRASLTGLGLVSVEQFRERAERRGFAIDDLEARSPSADDLGPDEVSAEQLLGPPP